MEATTDIDKANMLNNYFYSTFNFHVNLDLPAVAEYKDPALKVIILKIHEVSKELRSVNINKAIGPDGIPSAVLKECHQELSTSLCQIQNQSLNSGKVPSPWKCANIVTV